MPNILVTRLYIALTTLPDASKLLRLFMPLLGLIILLLIIGFKSRFLEIHLLKSSRKEIIKIVITSFFTPALAEEIVFRILFLPHPVETPLITTQILWGTISLAAFIIYHPLQGLTWNQVGYNVFTNPSFLILSAILGAMCTIAYLVVGSIWPSVIIHWLAVVIWIVLLDGFAKFPNI
ncbi:CPBP family intramembrane metalloprotease [Nostoc sp. HG1]|nr:CPBP family intramembrane metalloprotease [Nostoc sp. HG1]